jgi:adenylate kinase
MTRDLPRIVVVGTCASGKSTLVEELKSHGLDAYVCAQEHSDVPTLWRHLSPNFVVLLETDLETIRERRSPSWPESIYQRQVRRLEHARSVANLIVNTRVNDVGETVNQVQLALNDQGFEQTADV